MTVEAVIEQGLLDQNAISVQPLGLIVEKSTLLKALGHIQSVVERRNTIPILGNVKIEAKNNLLSLTSTDMDISATESIPADIQAEGALTVPAHTLYDIVRKLADGSQIQLTCNAQTGFKLSIVSGACEFALSCLPVEDFPVIDRGEMSHQFSLTKEQLVALLDKTKFAISTEETRYYLNGIYLHEKQGNLVTVATDGHRLAAMKFEAPEGVSGMPGVIIPRKTVAEIRKLVDVAEGDIGVALSDTKIAFEFGTASVISKLIDGTFPEYEKVIPSGNDKDMTVPTAALISSVDRVATIASDKTRAIKLAFSNNKLTLTASNEDAGTAQEEIEVVYEGESFDIGFNSRYLLEMLSGFEGKTAIFSLAGGSAPALVKDDNQEGALYVIMPMRI
jgi:DNA polymerase-3 subunit beta